MYDNKISTKRKTAHVHEAHDRVSCHLSCMCGVWIKTCCRSVDRDVKERERIVISNFLLSLVVGCWLLLSRGEWRASSAAIPNAVPMTYE